MVRNCYICNVKPEYLKKADNANKLVLIIGGWNTDPAFYSRIRPRAGWDVAAITDFEHLEPLEIPVQYTTVYLYAWSFGVVAAEHIADSTRITEAFAICGTPEGIGDYGIPTPIFQTTRDNLTLSSLTKFRRRMLSGLAPEKKAELQNLLAAAPDIEQLRRQLDSIANVEKSHRIHWRRAYIGLNDLIIPASAQRKAWLSHEYRPDIVELDTGHYPDIEQIIHLTTPDTQTTAESFSKSQDTYLQKADAQHHFARKLAEQLYKSEQPIKKILEIGNGTGILSRLMAKRWPDAEVTFVDLCATEPYHLFTKEEYITADAEEWMEHRESGDWDLIVSASAVQWFANPRTFFRNAARLLKNGGKMGATIFSSGNLRELDPARPSPIHYHTAQELGSMAEEYFGECNWEEDEYVMQFSSGREALLHLRDTGVKGGLTAPLSKLLRALRAGRLTYRSVIVTGGEPGGI